MRKLKRIVKEFVLRTLFKLLRKLDDSLLLRPQDPRPHSQQEPLELPNILKQPIVVNEGGIIDKTEVYDLYLSTLVVDKPPRFVSLIDYGTKIKNQGIATFEEMLEKFIDWAKEELEKANDDIAKLEWLGLIQHLISAKARNVKNRGAYRAKSREEIDKMYWPDPTKVKNPTSLKTTIPLGKKHPFIDRTTKIGSAGSCFAMEIAYRLQRDGYKYIVTEPHITSEENLSQSCARWGTIFNTPSFRQLIERSFGISQTLPLLWSTVGPGGKVELHDPYREDILFSSVEDYVQDWQKHRGASRRALEQVDVFILTLGMNEVWKLKADGTVFSRSPWRIAAGLIEQWTMSVEDNLRELETMLRVWRRFNPKVKIIVSVSPVPLHATYRSEEQHVVAANCHSKCTLRVVAEEFSKRNNDVFYFPSYEVVTSCTQNPWQEDERHVSKEAVSNVMNLFEQMFLKS